VRGGRLHERHAISQPQVCCFFFSAGAIAYLDAGTVASRRSKTTDPSAQALWSTGLSAAIGLARAFCQSVPAQILAPKVLASVGQFGRGVRGVFEQAFAPSGSNHIRIWAPWAGMSTVALSAGPFKAWTRHGRPYRWQLDARIRRAQGSAGRQARVSRQVAETTALPMRALGRKFRTNSPERRRRLGGATGKTDRFSRSGFRLPIAESNSAFRNPADNMPRPDRRAPCHGEHVTRTPGTPDPEGGRIRAQSIDYDGLMKSNLSGGVRASGNTPPAAKKKSRKLYGRRAVLYEPPGASDERHCAINQRLQALMSRPAEPSLRRLRPLPCGSATPVLGGGCAGNPRSTRTVPVAVNGIDVARIEGGRYLRPPVFLDPPSP